MIQDRQSGVSKDKICLNDPFLWTGCTRSEGTCAMRLV